MNIFTAKKLFILLLFFAFIPFSVVAEDVIDDEGNDRSNITIVRDGVNVAVSKYVPEPPLRTYESGPTLELSAFNYFSIGFGHYMAIRDRYESSLDFGYLVKYKTLRELHLRLHLDHHFGDHGFLTGFLLGGSAIMATDFDKITYGAAPHIGFGLVEIKLFYRYNFYLDKSFNSHEIVLQLLFPI